ncbi:MAG TPA: GntG family PLP-dependent aldolase [Saprospiraceae bacterium]|jgi:threonine aldolase|nr:aminotransferase class I/II-fold pyridoxal phosphate-dependent enzyme [Saprospiraceae bacterium]MCC6688938.1 aminotransferase class I/II-fold pyridoxal phosphate-dependent enzyme [Saprospiraceae bacterium]HMZ74226.1 GntG family PLP-dependent aldolase [Saprospiraceae bacterium]HND16588.1 GntG family PLP-dependent aldolase [Saprospiraceae bacterium]HNE65569.1 GntG family PLP-dependent aldolase [Saprospiraceae bacterium]
MINLISDTVTRPTPAMLNAMYRAEVGDDVFRDDPTVNRLQKKVAEMFGHEDALFCPSGTMTNQIAIKAHTQPLDEIICDENSHIFQYELGGYGFHSGAAILPLKCENGKLTADIVKNSIRPPADWLPNSRLVVIENTGNRTGGNFYTKEEIQPIAELCKAEKLKLHLDGARIFNALAESGDTPKETGERFDSISVCLSKGLGAPVGSVLTGCSELIQKARKIRKVMGGGMRQAGYLAAAGIFALDNHISRLKEDHKNAAQLAAALAECSFVKSIKPVFTNIVIFELDNSMAGDLFVQKLKEKGILVSAFAPYTVRMVTHLDVSKEMIDQVCHTLKRF